MNSIKGIPIYFRVFNGLPDKLYEIERSLIFNKPSKMRIIVTVDLKGIPSKAERKAEITPDLVDYELTSIRMVKAKVLRNENNGFFVYSPPTHIVG